MTQAYHNCPGKRKRRRIWKSVLSDKIIMIGWKDKVSCSSLSHSHPKEWDGEKEITGSWPLKAGSWLLKARNNRELTKKKESENFVSKTLTSKNPFNRKPDMFVMKIVTQPLHTCHKKLCIVFVFLLVSQTFFLRGKSNGIIKNLKTEKNLERNYLIRKIFSKIYVTRFLIFLLIHFVNQWKFFYKKLY